MSESEKPAFSLEVYNGLVSKLVNSIRSISHHTCDNDNNHYNLQLVAAVDVSTRAMPQIMRVNTTLNCNRDWHPIRASFSVKQVWLQLDDERPVVANAPDSFDLPQGYELSHGPLYIGGLPYTADRGSLLTNKNLVGCISDMSIAQEPVSWGSLKEARNVRHHMCPDF